MYNFSSFALAQLLDAVTYTYNNNNNNNNYNNNNNSNVTENKTKKIQQQQEKHCEATKGQAILAQTTNSGETDSPLAQSFGQSIPTCKVKTGNNYFFSSGPPGVSPFLLLKITFLVAILQLFNII